MVERRWISEKTKNNCLSQQIAAESEGCLLSEEITLEEGRSKLFVSVKDRDTAYYSRLGRVVVYFDQKNNTWHCPCSKQKNNCPHKSIAKWHLNQEHPQLFRKVRSTDSDVFDVFEESTGHETRSVYPPVGLGVMPMVMYLLKNKTLPAVLPKDVSSSCNINTLPQHLIPLEAFCAVCPGRVPLSEPILVSQKAKIVTSTGVKDVSTYCKKCGICGTFYRYQEWNEGLHNFDDHVVLTLHLCLFLRQCVQNHTAVGRAIDILEQTSNTKFPNHDAILHGYLHFEALTAHNYNYSCVNCGVHPPVVIMDLHKKGVFSMPVTDIEDPPSNFDGRVDAEEFWHSVEKEIVCRGFLKSNRDNPCKVPPSYDKWAPWIGPHTRAEKVLLNTEFAKCATKKPVAEMTDIEISEERLSSELMNLKVDTLRKLVRECGVDSKGSKMDLLLRLRDEMKRSTYDKVFQAVWGASGGWAVIMCPCGIVNSIKFNIRAESPRDYTDMLLSFKHFPNITIYDFARGLVTHTNLREPERLPFSPHEGRLATATPENISSAKSGKLRISLPWLQKKKCPPDLHGHPETGSEDHYALYDTFHQFNTKDEKDSLRLIGLVPELSGWLNAQTAEQLFSGMRKNNYFMNSLSPSSHVFLMRNILHHRNDRLNQQAIYSLKKAFNGNVILDTNGKAILTTSVSLPFNVSATTGSSAATTSESRNSESQGAQEHLAKDVDRLGCGWYCEAATQTSNLRPCRSSWTIGDHPEQQQLLGYILDDKHPENEIIIKDCNTCLTRGNFQTLGLRKDMDSEMGNACLRLVQEILQIQGKSIHVVDLYIPPTWLPTSNCNPAECLPVNSQNMDAIVIPLWVPGHFMLCVMKPMQKDILFIDSQYHMRKQGFGHDGYRTCIRQNICSLLLPSQDVPLTKCSCAETGSRSLD